jgi:hypothetical protein
MAAFLGHELEGKKLREVELHLANCTACRQEVLDSAEVLRAGRRVPWRVVAPAAAAAAVILLIFPWPIPDGVTSNQPAHREAPGTGGPVPVLVSPLGSVSEVSGLVWTRVPGADQYRVVLFDSEGLVLWRDVTPDSSAVVPDSVSLQTNRPYLWRVEARIGWDLWDSSELREFRIMREPPAGTGGVDIEGTP